MEGLNDISPFLLTWKFGDWDFALYIEKNLYQADLEKGWTLEKRGHKFLVTLEPEIADTENDDGNGEHRYWKVSIQLADKSTDVKLIGSGTVAWGEFFLMD